MTSDAATRLPASQPRSEGEDEIDLAQLFALLWGGKWTVLLATFAMVFIGCVYLVAARPVFRADGTVQVEENKKGGGMQAAMGDLASLFGSPMETEAEIQILQSRMILIKVIDALNLEIIAEPRYFPIIGHFIARHRTGLDEPAPAPLGLGSFAWGGESIEVSTLNVGANLLGLPLRLSLIHI